MSEEGTRSPAEPDPGAAAALAARLVAIPEPRMRAAAMAEALASGPAASAVRLLGDVIAGGGASPGHRAAAFAAVAVLSDGGLLDYDRRAALYAAAIDAGDEEVALILLDAAPPAPGTEALERQLDAERPLAPRGRPLTLGERKALARGHRRELLLQLARDPHPAVIAVLLESPHLTEADVIHLASRRPMLPAALAAIAAAERWRVRPAVRRALVLNPMSPAPLVARLMLTLGDGDLEEAACEHPGLPERLRRHAAALLARRLAARGAQPGGAPEPPAGG